MIFEMIWWGLGGQKRRRKHPTAFRRIGNAHRRHKAEKDYVKRSVRRMELNAEARRIYAQRHPKPQSRPQVNPMAAPESRYSKPEFWQARRPQQPQPVKPYKDPRDFWSL
jgi:hypothetical protein